MVFTHFIAVIYSCLIFTFGIFDICIECHFLVLNLEQHEPYWCLSCKNDGQGILKDAFEKVLKKYY